jgi:signal transduction histidine kinase
MGAIALPLAVPPGFSSPIWPASAVVAVAFWQLGLHAVLPILVSSFFLNFVRTGIQDLDLLWAMSAGIVACGTIIQGAIGGRVIARLEMLDPRLATIGAPLRFTGYLAILTCSINALFSVSLLTMIGVIPRAHAVTNWLTWWLGDALGICVLLAPLFLWFSVTAPPERSRAYSVALFSFILIALTLPAFWFISRYHLDQRRAEIIQSANQITRQIESIRNQHETLVSSLGALLVSVEDLDFIQFNKFTYPLLQEFPAIQALEWISRVNPSERTSYEARMREAVHPEFTIRQHRPGNALEQAPNEYRDYYPVTFVAPLSGNENALGFDLASESNRARALAECTQRQRLTSSRTVVLVQESESESHAHLVFSPVNRLKHEEPGHIDGFALGVFRVNDIVESALQGIPANGLKFSIFDPRDPSIRIYSNVTDQTLQRPGDDSEMGTQRFQEVHVSSIVGLTSPWEVNFLLSSEIYGFENWWTVWLVFFTVSVLVFVCIGFFTHVSAQPELIQRVVDQRTNELKITSEALVQLNNELETKVARRTRDLARANEDLSAFVHSASHDLQAPLRKQQMFVEILDKELDTRSITPDANLALRAINNAATSMRNLITGLLALSRAERQTLKIESISLDKLVDEVLNDFEDEIKTGNIEIQRDSFPTIHGDRRLLSVLYHNLISNAIKFSSGNPKPTIRISYRISSDIDAPIMEVSDNGIGIPSEDLQDVFSTFTRLHSQSEFPGSGVGLSICKRIANRLEGKIWAEESPLGGALFSFWIRCEPDEKLNPPAHIPLD